jgi:peroxiredoxin
VRLVAISYDPVDKLAEFAQKRGIGYSLLSDPDSSVIKRYGVYDEDGYAHPGTYLIDPAGVVQWARFIPDIRIRHKGAELVAAVRELAARSRAQPCR